MKRLLLAIGMLPLAACGAGSPPDGSAPEPTATTATTHAALSVRLGADATDSPGMGPRDRTGELREAVVSIDRVSAHLAGAGWMILSSRLVDVDVLRLETHAIELGFARLPAGHVTQVRLHVAEGSSPHVTTSTGATIPLKVPSGMQSGIKIKGDWDIEACKTTTLNFELGKKAIKLHPTGREDLWILRPVIKAGSVDIQAVCDPSDPTETDPETSPPIAEPDPSDTTDPTDPSDTPDQVDPSDPSDPTAGEPAPAPGDGSTGTNCTSSQECGTFSFCSEAGVCEPLNL